MTKKEQSWKNWSINIISSAALPYVNQANRVYQEYVINRRQNKEQVERDEEAKIDYDEYFDDYKRKTEIDKQDKVLSEDCDDKKEEIRKNNGTIQLRRQENHSENRFILIINNVIKNIPSVLSGQKNNKRKDIRAENARLMRIKYNIQDTEPTKQNIVAVNLSGHQSNIDKDHNEQYRSHQSIPNSINFDQIRIEKSNASKDINLDTLLKKTERSNKDNLYKNMLDKKDEASKKKKLTPTLKFISKHLCCGGKSKTLE